MNIENIIKRIKENDYEYINSIDFYKIFDYDDKVLKVIENIDNMTSNYILGIFWEWGYGEGDTASVYFSKSYKQGNIYIICKLASYFTWNGCIDYSIELYTKAIELYNRNILDANNYHSSLPT